MSADPSNAYAPFHTTQTQTETQTETQYPFGSLERIPLAEPKRSAVRVAPLMTPWLVPVESSALTPQCQAAGTRYRGRWQRTRRPTCVAEEEVRGGGRAGRALRVVQLLYVGCGHREVVKRHLIDDALKQAMQVNSHPATRVTRPNSP